jgi:hypothetical protein
VVGPRKPEYLEPQASLGIGSKGIVPLGLRRMSARPILVRLRPRFRRMLKLALFLLWVAPTHSPVAASVVVVVRGLAVILRRDKM